jgi:diguanylate cyclase (GGDEF)-like protein/PAS domain S-box-containing protein
MRTSITVEARRQKRAETSAARWFHALIAESGTGHAAVALDGTILAVNEALLALSGYRRGIAVKFSDCVVATERTAVEAAFTYAVLGKTARIETILRHADGSSSIVGLTLYPLHRGKKIVAVGARLHDRTHMREAEQRRLENQQSIRLRQLYLVAASAGRSPAQQIQGTLELGLELFGCNRAFVNEIVGDDLVARFIAGTRARREVGTARKLAESFARPTLRSQDVVAVDDLDLAPWDSDVARTTSTATAIISTRVERFGKLYGTLGFATDSPGGRHFFESEKDLVRLMGALCGSSLERLAHEERLGSLAFYDALTGLPNRVLFDDRVEQTLVAARRHKQKFSILFFDLDDFKEVNDLHGHVTGDELLRVVAHRLQGVARESDTVARHGGDEFVALQRFVRSPQDAMRMARRINEALRQPIIVEDLVLAISASIGVAVYPDHGTTAQELLAHADRALYRAKNAGRDRAVLYKELVPAAT